MTPSHLSRRGAATTLLLGSFTASLTAQDPGTGSQDPQPDPAALERRITELEARLAAQEAQGQMVPGASSSQNAQRRGIGSRGQTTIFDSIFNPALSLIGDFVLAGSNQTDSFETANQFVLRDIELGVVGRIDPAVSYQLYVHFEEDEVEVEEAYVLADNWLPDTFMLKAGQYNIDFGKLSPGLLREFQEGKGEDILAASPLDLPPERHLRICQSLTQQIGGEFTLQRLEDGRTLSRLVVPIAAANSPAKSASPQQS